MRFWKLIISLVLFYNLPITFAQQFPIQLEDTTVKVVSDFLGNVYTISATTLQKHSAVNSENFVYSKKQFGEIHDVCVSNPHKLIVFFKNTNKLFLLDKYGGEVGKSIDFSQSDNYDVESVCIDSENHIWAYNSETQKLIQFNLAGRVLYESTDLSRYIEFNDDNSVRLRIVGQQLALMDVDKIIFFSAMGSYIRTLYLKTDKKCFEPVGDQLFCLENNSLLQYSIEANDFKFMTTTDSFEVSFVTKKCFYFRDNTMLYFKSIEAN